MRNCEHLVSPERALKNISRDFLANTASNLQLSRSFTEHQPTNPATLGATVHSSDKKCSQKNVIDGSPA
jgi:hypothetical protein